MILDKFFANYFQGRRDNEEFFRDFFKDYLMLKADQKEAEISKELMRNLVHEYSKSEKRLRELNELKNKFLGIAAHDLRNPLISLQGFSELMLMEIAGPITDQQKEYLEIMNISATQMLTLVNDLLDFSAIERQGFKLNISLNNLKDIAKASVLLNSQVAEKKNIKILEFMDDVPDIMLDKSRIVQVVDNLIGNAVKFSPFDTEIKVYLQLFDGFVVLKVADEGPGISENDRDKLFKEFSKTDNQPTGGEKSTGLGLSIAHKIIEEHGGELYYEPGEPKGSVFCFKLLTRGSKDGESSSESIDS